LRSHVQGRGDGRWHAAGAWLQVEAEVRGAVEVQCTARTLLSDDDESLAPAALVAAAAAAAASAVARRSGSSTVWAWREDKRGWKTSRAKAHCGAITSEDPHAATTQRTVTHTHTKRAATHQPRHAQHTEQITTPQMAKVATALAQPQLTAFAAAQHRGAAKRHRTRHHTTPMPPRAGTKPSKCNTPTHPTHQATRQPKHQLTNTPNNAQKQYTKATHANINTRQTTPT
jgi:hypothetical protein